MNGRGTIPGDQRLLLLPILALITMVTGCQTARLELAKQPGELCRVYDAVATPFDEHGVSEWCTTGILCVYSDGRFASLRRENSRPIGPLDTGRLTDSLLFTLKQSIALGSPWTEVDGVPTYYISGDDSWTKHPDWLFELRKATLAQFIARCGGATAGGHTR